MKMHSIASIIFTLIVTSSFTVSACTGFTSSDDNTVLVGNNEDYSLDCEPKIKVYPPADSMYGRIVFCNKPYPFENMPYFEFGGMNDQGLFFDSFAHPYRKLTNSESKPVYNGWYIPNCLKYCATVEEAIDDFTQWHHPMLENNQILIVDRTGNSAIIEGDTVISKSSNFQVCTNFLQSNPDHGWYPCWRYETAVDMLENMNQLSVEYFRDICNATHSEGMYSYTIYSNVYDLINGVVYLYYMHDYSTVKTFDLSTEVSNGTQSYLMSDLFDDRNIKPDTPLTPTGPSTGKINEEHQFITSTIDMDKDKVFYYFKWGDGSNSGWLGPYLSGVEVNATHKWNEKGDYTVRVKAKDTWGAESEWSDPLAVTMPKNKAIKTPFLRFLENHPHLFPLLRQLLGLEV